MSQIASKVRYSPSQHAVVALSSDTLEHALGPLLRLLRRPLPLPMLAPSPKHVQIARNADRSIAIEPLRAPGYAPPIANAPRRELAELLRPRECFMENELWR